ncbi:hypothetical protein [uncultured Massilia sp.]|uniref:hypothetical protein n=1 Tax=uncultured Massilia sp. TaxID=169973 RepID=UPI0035A34ECB
MHLPLPHLLNLALHVGAGIAAIVVGLGLLAKTKGTPTHRRRGRIFVAFTLLVCATGIIGSVLFRFIPLFAVLTLLVTYQLLSGWHAVHTKAAGPDRIDALLLALRAYLQDGGLAVRDAVLGHRQPGARRPALVAAGAVPAGHGGHHRVHLARAPCQYKRQAHPTGQTGFGDGERMRRAFVRTLGKPPQAVLREARQQRLRRAGIRHGHVTRYVRMHGALRRLQTAVRMDHHPFIVRAS